MSGRHDEVARCGHLHRGNSCLLLFCCRPSRQDGDYEMARRQEWSMSLTYDDGSINQFRVAVPIMDSFGFPATFFIITGNIPGSRYHGTFVGRPTNGGAASTPKTCSPSS